MINMLQLRKEIKAEEGFRPYCYPDQFGFWTIGIGRLCDKRKAGSGLSEQEADFLLDNDINRVLGILDAKLPWLGRLSDLRQRAVINMAFQLGVDGLLKFTAMLEAMKNNDFKLAAEHALDSAWARQTPERAKRVSEMIEKEE